MKVAPKIVLVREIQRQRTLLSTFKRLLHSEQSAANFWRNRYQRSSTQLTASLSTSGATTAARPHSGTP
jgi:hypothetical protein